MYDGSTCSAFPGAPTVDPVPSRFTEVADRVWVARYPTYDVNVSLVGGADGLVVVDTHASAAHAREVVEDVRALGAGDVVRIVNTHEHFDHWLGNGTVRAAWPDREVAVHAHETAAAAMTAYAADPPSDVPEGTVPAPADHTFSSVAVIDLGDRAVELVHPGRGHTAGDLVVRVADADVLLAGDLVEESAEREATPGFGADCFPLEWPLTLDFVVGLTEEGTTVVPGHGAVSDRDFLLDQRARIGVLAETIRDLAERGVRVEDALTDDDVEWPFPRRYLDDAVRRAYDHLPRSQKRLPLL
ncbi:MAG: MBL fold metallo-hydrolase [Nocardioides sp.]|nr:MBL fold metallo-hydrolase [Nocardioides sp.]